MREVAHDGGLCLQDLKYAAMEQRLHPSDDNYVQELGTQDLLCAALTMTPTLSLAGARFGIRHYDCPAADSLSDDDLEGVPLTGNWCE